MYINGNKKWVIVNADPPVTGVDRWNEESGQTQGTCWATT
jgi:hypothetical protein